MILTHFDTTGAMTTYIGHMPMPIPLRFGFLFLTLGMILTLILTPIAYRYRLSFDFIGYFLFGGIVIFLISTIVASFTDPIAMFGYGY